MKAKICLLECFVIPFSEFEIKRSDGRKTAIARRTLNNIYDAYVYAVILRACYHIARLKVAKKISTLAVNVKTKFKNPATGRSITANIASLMSSTKDLRKIDLQHVDAAEFFKQNRGVAASTLSDSIDVPPIMTFNKNDDRFIEGKSVASSRGENIAEMRWEDFEHLVRQLFELHFKGKDAEVRVTRSSRDRGVDAVIFDADPITGGKIVIQAKRYTNTVEVAAVRELFGTTQNEGANRGILVTTSNFGNDSYQFAKDKNITLINGAQFLELLKNHGFSYSLNLAQAKKNIAQNRRSFSY
jgi:restriction system protein